MSDETSAGESGQEQAEQPVIEEGQAEAKQETAPEEVKPSEGFKDPSRREPEEKIEGPERRMSKLEKLKCWPEVKAMLENSRPVADIVHHIQEVRGEYLEIKAPSLRTVIYQWVGRNGDKLSETRIPTKYLNLLDSTVERVDPLDAVNMIFAIHMDRVMIDYALESKIKKTVGSNTANLRLANEMIRTMSFLKSDSFKHKAAMADAKDGGMRGVKETFESIDRVKKAYEERYGRTAAAVALNPESRAKVYNALSRIRAGDAEPVMKILRQNSEKAKEAEETDKAEVES